MKTQTKPNIIIFNPDQWRSDVLGHRGNPAAVTPNLDRMVEEDALSISNAYCQNPVCTPSRCSFMTGLYPHNNGHRTMFNMLHADQGETNLLKILKENGYFVWWGGKNDLVPSGEDLSDYCDIKFSASEEDKKRWGYIQQESNHGGDLKWRGDIDGPNYYSFLKGKLDKGDKDIYFDDDWQRILGAIDFISNYDGDKPLCIYLPLSYPHPPYCVEEPWFSITDRSKIPLRIQAPEDFKGKASILKGIAKGQKLHDWTEEQFNELRAVYYGMCSRVDHQFGLLTDAMKEKKIYDDSAIFFFSDHGDYTGDYGIVEKSQNSFEDSISSVPFIIKPPSVYKVSPRVTDALAELIDFSATVFEMTGIDPGYDSFGRSLLPLIAGDTDVHREAVFCEGGRLKGETQAMERESYNRHDPARPGLYFPRLLLQITDEAPYHTKAVMCRTGSFKYVKRYYEDDEFYDLKIDPGEINNLISSSEYREKILEHKEIMLNWYMGTCDTVPRGTDKR